MARTTKKKEAVKETAVVTRAEKKDATKNLIRELLAVKPHKHNELLEGVSKLYTERFGGEETDNVNDVKGRVGSVLDIMKKEGDVAYEDGMYALKARALPVMPEAAEEKPAKKTTKSKKKTEEPVVKAEDTEEKPVKKTKKTAAKKEKAEPLPPAPIQPIAPVAPVTPESAPEPIPQDEEKPAPKKRGRKPKAKEVVTEKETPSQLVEAPTEKSVEEPQKKEEVQKEEPKGELIIKEKAEVAKKSVVMDMSFLFGAKSAQTPAKSAQTPAKSAEKTEKAEQKPTETKVEVKNSTPVVPTAPIKAVKTEEKPKQAPMKAEEKPAQTAKAEASKKTLKAPTPLRVAKKQAEKPLTKDERLKETFLKRIRSLGGDYFEYYSVYLLERYSLKNGRRLEGMKINGGDHDGGIDGEIELTDKLGFRETIYIQSKNWNPEKGDEKLWVVGETLLQQFIGACACRQARDGKQNCRGIFITTSRFTPDAKRILETMSDKIVGYDGNDLYDAAKECSFGLVQKNGEWVLDEKLLAGSKAFFNLY